MRNHPEGTIRTLLSSVILVALGTAFIVGAQDRRRGNWDDLSSQAHQP